MGNKTVRQIDVTEGLTPVSYLDKEGKKHPLGVVKRGDYSGEGGKMQFIPTPNNPFIKKRLLKPYALGFGSSHVNFVNPADAQEVMIDCGGTIRNQFAMKGGLRMRTDFSFVDSEREDPFIFDDEYWKESGRTKDIWFGCSLTTNIQMGLAAAKFDFGFWRQFCENGMSAKILGLPSFSFKHSDWDVDRIRESITDAVMSGDEFSVRGPVVSRAGMMRRGIAVLKDYIELTHILDTPEDDDDDEDTEKREKVVIVPTEFKLLEKQFKVISPNMVRPRVLWQYTEMLDAMIDGHDDNDPIFAGDLSCAYTSAVNLYRRNQANDRGVFRALDTGDGVVGLTTTLASLATLFNRKESLN